MSRSGYVDDLDDDLAMGRWRGIVASAIRGKRGWQKLLVDLLAALDAMPEKALIAADLETEDGEVCALGAVGKARGIDLASIDPGDPEDVAATFDIAEPLAQELVYVDEHCDFRYVGGKRVDFTPEERWIYMRAWVAGKISKNRGDSSGENAKTPTKEA